MKKDGRRIGFYLIQLVIIECEDAGGQRDRIQMHVIVFYYQPAIPIIVIVLVFLSIFYQILPKPLADLYHERNCPKEGFVSYGCDDEYGCQLPHLCCVVLFLSINKS